MNMEWISIEHLKPPKDIDVLLCRAGVVTFVGRKRYGMLGEPQQDLYTYRDQNGHYLEGVTHWMLLPAQPPAIKQ